MKYLKSAKNGRSGFSAKFTNGQTTKSHAVASFFMMMQDKKVTPDELDSYIHIGEMCDPGPDHWKEIRRIADTFAQAVVKS